MNELDRRALLAGAGVLSAAALAAGGPLNPPAGPVASTAGPEPRIPVNAVNTPGTGTSQFRISQPGSYYLPAGFVAPAGANGILIEASDVTLDLMGFTILGSGGAGGHGVFVNGAMNNVSVCNGVIRGFGGYGLQSFSGLRNSAIGLRVSNNLQGGIAVNQFGRVVDCQCGNNTTFGISVNTGSQVSGCVANNNGNNGFNAGPTCTFVQCTAFQNGADGFGTSSSSVLKDCTAHANAFHGYSLGSSSVARGCVAYFNGGSGFSMLSGSSLCEACVGADNGSSGFTGTLALRGCIAHSNDMEGINNGAYVDSCTVSNNTEKGIETAAGGMVVNSRSYQNGGAGIEVTTASMVAGCLVYQSAEVGITSAANCDIRENLVYSPGSGGSPANGIFATGGTAVRDNTVVAATATALTIGVNSLAEGNFVAAGAGGYAIGSSSFAVRNAATGNTGVDYTIAAAGLSGSQVTTPNVPTANSTANLQT